MKYVLILCSVLSLWSCHCHKTTEASQKVLDMDQMVAVAKDKYVENYELIYNESKNYAFVIKDRKVKSMSPFPPVLFMVYKVDNQELIYKDIVPGGKVKWISDDLIEVLSLVGMPRDLNAKKLKPLYNYNVKTRTKN